AVRLIGRHQAPQRMAQIRQHAALVDGLHALQALYVQNLSPERQPRRAGALIELLRSEVGVNYRLHTPARRAGTPQPLSHALPDAARQSAESSLEQTVLVVEVVRDQSGGNTGALRDLRQGAADVPDVGQAVDRHLDELLPARFLGHLARSCAIRRIVAARA